MLREITLAGHIHFFLILLCCNSFMILWISYSNAGRRKPKT